MVSTIFLRKRSNQAQPMPTRRSHNKSRKGCITCKRRRVKCDEQYPICGACSARGTECEYAAAVTASQKSSSTEQRPLSGSSHDQSFSTQLQDDADSSEWRINVEADTKLQLELMHQWTTSTYESFCRSTDSDRAACQVEVPKVALKHDFLLHAVLAAAAFDLAIFTNNDRRLLYIRAGFSQKQLALEGFRTALPNLNPTNHEALLHCSAILMVLSLASLQLCPPSQENCSTIEKILDHVQLTRGITVVYEANPETLRKSTLLQDYLPFEELLELPIDANAEKGLKILSDWNNARPAESPSGSRLFEARRKSMANKAACDRGLFWLREFYSKCNGRDSRGYILGWPEVAGEEYLTAVRERDHVALAMLAYWGVMVEEAAKEVWWARKVGSLLFTEISEALADEADHGAYDIMAEIGRQLRAVQATTSPFSMTRGSISESEVSRAVIESTCVPKAQTFRQCVVASGLLRAHEMVTGERSENG